MLESRLAFIEILADFQREKVVDGWGLNGFAYKAPESRCPSGQMRGNSHS
jgi:hypothetical protein